MDHTARISSSDPASENRADLLRVLLALALMGWLSSWDHAEAPAVSAASGAAVQDGS